MRIRRPGQGTRKDTGCALLFIVAVSHGCRPAAGPSPVSTERGGLEKNAAGVKGFAKISRCIKKRLDGVLQRVKKT